MQWNRSSITNLIDQQYGLLKWKFNYDSIVQRFACHKDEQYTLLLPLDDERVQLPIFCCKFARNKRFSNLFVLSNDDGKIAIHDTTNRKPRYGIRAHNSAVFDVDWTVDGMRMITGAADYAVKLFDVSDGGIQELNVFYGHSKSVKTVAFRKGANPNVFASSGRDGNIIVWDARSGQSGKPSRIIHNAHPVKKELKSNTPPICDKTVTSLVFQDYSNLISGGAGTGTIKVWDLRKLNIYRKNKPIPKLKLRATKFKDGFSSFVLDNSYTKLYANCLDDTIYCFNVAAYNSTPIMKYTGHKNNSFYVKSALSKDGTYLVSGSSDKNAYIWNTNRSRPIAKLTGHSDEVTSVTWSPDDLTLVTCSDDMSHRIWRIGSEKLADNWKPEDGITTAEVVPPDKRETKKLQKMMQKKIKRKRYSSPIRLRSSKRLAACKTCIGDGVCQNNCNLVKRSQVGNGSILYYKVCLNATNLENKP